MSKKPKYKQGPENPHWDEFVKWADANGVSLDHSEDWFPWWECWWNGFMVGAYGKGG